MTMKEAIAEAKERNNEIIIFDSFLYFEERWWDNRPSHGWQVSGEMGWILSTEEVENMNFQKVNHDKGISTIYVDRTDW